MGVLLDGRYRLLQRRTKSGSAATWDGEDDQLQRPVVLHVVSGEAAAEAVDAARRSAAVEDERLPHVLDVGLDSAADGTALGWVVTERSPGRSLADLLREAPLPAARARALVGEAAAVLARASRAGLHHRHLEPHSVLLTADGAVSVLGLEVAAAAAGAPRTTPAAADREDAVGLARVLYAALTGMWPAGRCGSLGAAPTGRGGAPVAPGELVSGVPHDLDAFCSAVLGPYDDGPRSPEEVAAVLAPWGSSTGPVTHTGLGIPAAPAPLRPADAGRGTAPAGAWASTPARARLGGGPGLHFAGAAGAAGAAQAVDRPTERVVDLRDPRPAGDGDLGGTRVLRRRDEPAAAEPATPAPSPTASPGATAPVEYATRASRRAELRRAEQAGIQHAAPADDRGRATTVVPPHGRTPGRPEPTAAPAATPHRAPSSFDDTDATDWVGAGWGAAPTGAPPVRRRVRSTAAAAPQTVAEAPVEPRRRRRRGPVAAGVVALLLVGGVGAVAFQQRHEIAGALGIATSAGTDTSGSDDTAQAQTGLGEAEPAPSSAPSASATPGASAAAAAGEVSSVAVLDPFGDQTENDASVGRAVDGSTGTSWTSSTYKTAALGGLKRGVGLSLELGDGQTASSVTALTLTSQGSGGTVEVRTSPDGTYEGSKVVATAPAGTGGQARTVTFDSPVSTTHLLLWFTSLPQSQQGFTAVVDEVSVR